MKTTRFLQRSAIVIFLCVLLIDILSGCIYVGSNPSRVNLNEVTASRIIPGKTTREEVVRLLGEPDEVSANGKQLTFLREYELAVISFGALREGKAPKAANRYVLVVEFDERCIVSRRDFIEPYEFHDKPLRGAPPFNSPPSYH